MVLTSIDFEKRAGLSASSSGNHTDVSILTLVTAT